MNPNKTVEYNSLSWVKAQLDDVLSDAQSNLNDYIESKNDEDLENCIEHLQLIYGTLQMVEVYGASMLAEEMQYTTTALLEDKVESAYDAYDVLMRAMLQLPDYLESIQAGKADAPITLMPLINDLRAARNEGLLSEGSLFSPDIENAELVSGDYDAASIESGKLQDEVKRLRTHYQLGLLDYIRNNKETAGLKRIKAVLKSLEKVTSDTEVRHMWMVIVALVDALLDKGIDDNLTVQKLLGSVDRQLKQILTLGEAEFANQYSKELVTNALYYVGLSSVENESVAAVKDAYNLGELLPQDTEEASAAAVGGLNADLFDTVSKGITEDLGQVKDVLELYMHSNDKNIKQLTPVSEQLGKIGDTYGMLGMGATRQAILDQRVVLDKIISGESEIDEQTILGIASELLNAESELKNFIADRSGFVDMNRSTEDQAVPAAEYRQVVFTVVSEGLKNFSEAKEAILLYVTGNGDEAQLDLILNRLEEVRGVAMMLPLGRVELQIEKLQKFITTALLNNNHQVTAEEQDTVADVVTSIEYFLEALSEGRPGVEQGLNAGDVAADKLDAITQGYLGDEPAAAETALDVGDEDSGDEDTGGDAETVSEDLQQAEDQALDKPVAEEFSAEEMVVDTLAFDTSALDTDVPAESSEQPEIEVTDNTFNSVIDEDTESEETLALAPAASVPQPVAEDTAQYTILADDADEEIVEIFIEEAVEVLGELHENLPLWKDNNDDSDALTVVRRCFHTLKGSGRLLGAEMIGEFSWKFENMLNRIIENKINVSDDLFQALDEALAVIPQLIEQLKGNREPIENIGQLMAAADAIADGREYSFDTDALDMVSEQAAPDDLASVTETDDSLITEESAVILDFSDKFEAGSDEAITLPADEQDTTEPDEITLEIENDHAGEPESVVSADASDDDSIEILGFDEDSADLSISDDSGVDISVLDPENNAPLEAADQQPDQQPDQQLDKSTFSEQDTTERDEVLPGGHGEAGEHDVQIDEEVISLASVGEEVALGEDDFDDEFDNLSIAESDDSGEQPADEAQSELLADAETAELPDVVISDDDEVISIASESIDIDPMLLKIYYDESLAHVENVREYFAQCENENLPVTADKDLVRAFHTLYGSARTAEVDSIAELTGTTEKYLKARQDSAIDEIPEDAVAVLQDIEKSVSSMLEAVAKGTLPATDKALHEKISKIFQHEIQSQLQQSWQGSSAAEPALDDASADVDSVVESSLEELEISEVENDSGADFEADTEAVSDEVFTADSNESAVEEAEGDRQTHTSKASAIDEPVEMPYGEIDDELIDIFLEEADELLESCEQILVSLRNEPDSVDHVHQLQRNMHTLKGGARMADLTPVGDLTHNLESLVVLVNEKKVYADKVLFDLLQESLDVLTSMLAAVKKRESLVSAAELNERIELMMRGEVKDKRSVERFDIDYGDLGEQVSDDAYGEEDEDLEEVDIANLLLAKKIESSKFLDEQVATENVEDAESQPDETSAEEHQPVDEQVSDQSAGRHQAAGVVRRRAEDKSEERPHWGERATDVNFKDSQEQVRVRSDLLNNLVNYAGEVNIYHSRMGKQISDFGFNLSELTQTVVRLKEQLRNLEIETEIQIRSGYEKESDVYDDNFDPLEMDQYSTLQQLTRSLSETASDVDSINDILTDITRDAETLLVQESRVSTDLQEGLMRTRMVRFGGLSSRLRRIVRQVSRELGKEVEVEIEGESSEVDRTVLDRIIAPLEHMLRNAVAHGIESPEDRKALGKSESGTISIKIDRQGTDVVINMRDDGAGIDAHKIKEKAIRQGLLAADVEISDHDALQFILHSGFSTADEVTQVSGRGVGMDVVDSEIKQLGGVLEIDTTRGKGTEFTVRLPLTLAINQALLVSAADDVFAVPLASIEGVVRITGLELQRFYDSDNSHYEFNGVEYELKHLGELLSGQQPDYSKQLQLFPVLLVNVGDQHFALHVEDLIGRREIVVKPVGLQVGSVHGIAGATILADGRVVLILEMSALVVADSLFRSHAPLADEVPVEAVDTVKTIMVVDDSITIRKITERMLNRYGVNVILAKDGVDATNQLQDQIPDLMLLDIEMPRMDGFEVASYVRNDERLREIPIIMITSRTGSKHKEKAMEIGVDQYLGKPFQEDELISNINEILHTSL